MEIIVVSDTNIFIDLVKLNLLGDFFLLPWDIHTTDFVINELTDPEQNAAVTAFIKRKRLTVGKLSVEEIGEVVGKGRRSPKVRGFATGQGRGWPWSKTPARRRARPGGAYGKR